MHIMIDPAVTQSRTYSPSIKLEIKQATQKETSLYYIPFTVDFVEYHSLDMPQPVDSFVSLHPLVVQSIHSTLGP